MLKLFTKRYETAAHAGGVRIFILTLHWRGSVRAAWTLAVPA